MELCWWDSGLLLLLVWVLIVLGWHSMLGTAIPLPSVPPQGSLGTVACIWGRSTRYITWRGATTDYCQDVGVKVQKKKDEQGTNLVLKKWDWRKERKTEPAPACWGELRSLVTGYERLWSHITGAGGEEKDDKEKNVLWVQNCRSFYANIFSRPFRD